MRIKLLLTLLMLLGTLSLGWGQRFTNRNLYDVWISAEEHLDAGRFDDAIRLYGVAPEVPAFTKRLMVTKNLRTIFLSGERYFRTRRYAEALESFSRYRLIDPTLQVAVLDRRIQSCLRELDKITTRKLDESIRVVAGFEWAYNGEQSLATMDTVAARRSFSKAKQLGGRLNTTLRKQYEAGLEAVNQLSAWGRDYQLAASAGDKASVLESLKAYRSASKYIVSSVEYEIKSAEEGAQATLATASVTTLRERMQGYADECRVEDLYYFVKNNRRLIEGADTLTARIDVYRRTENELSRLKTDPGNRAFVASAYRSLIEKAGRIPGVSAAVEGCAARSYSDYLLESARLSETRGDESGDKDLYCEAVGYLADARALGLETTKTTLSEIQNRLSNKLDCDLRQNEFSLAATEVRQALSNCRVAEAWAIWEPALNRIVGCGLSDAAFFGQYLNLRDMVQRFHTSDSLYAALTQKGERALESKQCGPAKGIVSQIAALDLCDASRRDAALPIYAQRITECERITCFQSSRDRAFKSAESREWKSAYDSYQQAYDCAEESQKARIKQIMDDMECDAYPDRCRKGNVSTILQPIGRVGINNPIYFEDGLLKETNNGYFVSAGLQLSFLSYLSPLDVVIGAEYFRTKYMALGTAQGQTRSAGDYEIEGADVSLALKLHKSNTDPNRLRPYLKGGIEMLLPFGYSMTNHDKYESTTDRKFLKKQSLGLLGGLGVELQRKKFGFFVEAIFGYNFSGIYNSNVITASGSRGKTEANFRTAGLRAGIRFW